MKHIGNREKIAPEFVDDAEEKSLMKTLCLGAAGGSEKLYANIDRLKPGAKSCKFHSHTHQEEFFYILKGSCTLRVGDETHSLRAGDFFSKPAGKGIAHQFVNDSSETVEILDVGLNHEDDKVDYPEEGVVLHRKERKVFKGREEISGWSSDPNEV